MGFKEFEDCSGKWSFVDAHRGGENKFTNVIVSCGKNIVLKMFCNYMIVFTKIKKMYPFYIYN